MTPTSASAASPADLFGPLLGEVQSRRLFTDGKTFVDAVPLRPPGEIMAKFAFVPRDDEALRAFVQEHFTMPAPARVHAAHAERDLRRYIASLWPELERSAPAPHADGSLLPTSGSYVVPGGRFVELYYWDSYFSLLGLVRDGHEPLARSIVDSITGLIERHGHVPNGTRSYYLSRSQPPLYFAMVRLLPDARPEAIRRRLSAMLAEHRFWMSGADGLSPGERHRRVVAMPDGARLNRYWDDRDTPRDESFFEDVETAGRSSLPLSHIFRALRAGAESGWDFSSRWFADQASLATIATPDIVPVDLNAFLYGLERTIAEYADMLCEDALADSFEAAAGERRAAIDRWLWSDAGFFVDFDCSAGAQRHQLTAATLAPLFTRVATPFQAACVTASVSTNLLAPGGLRTTLVETGEQWDWPNGWAPLQWIAFAGLRAYGHRELAATIAQRWVATVDAEFQRSGWVHEKYDVERGVEGAGGEYAPQLGFGWTNGVTAAFIDLMRENALMHSTALSVAAE
jgi:alpha,alpha-trehalase